MRAASLQALALSLGHRNRVRQLCVHHNRAHFPTAFPTREASDEKLLQIGIFHAVVIWSRKPVWAVTSIEGSNSSFSAPSAEIASGGLARRGVAWRGGHEWPVSAGGADHATWREDDEGGVVVEMVGVCFS